MHEIDGNRPRPRLLAPRRHVEIAIRLVEPAGRLHGAHRADMAFADQFKRLANDRVVAAMMPHENCHTCLLGTVDQHARRVNVIGQRLFDQHRHTRLDTGQPLSHVKLGWRGQDDSVRRLGPDHAFEFTIPWHVPGRGLGLSHVARVDNRAKRCPCHMIKRVGMALPHETDARNGKTQARARLSHRPAISG